MLFSKHIYAIRLPLRNDITEQHKKLKSIRGKTKRLYSCRGELILEETRDIFPKEVKRNTKRNPISASWENKGPNFASKTLLSKAP